MIGSSNSKMKMKMKMRSSEHCYNFSSFMDQNFPLTFRDNIRLFLGGYSSIEDHLIEGCRAWITFLLVQDGGNCVIPFYTIEEIVTNPIQPTTCHHCLTSGWSDHLVAKRNYHFIIPNYKKWSDPLDEDVLYLDTHILHGLIHCNGLGHLLRINGKEGGSKFISGTEIMNLWDRICTSLGSRKISLLDFSQRRNMHLRLLYGASHGRSWFGKWGYEIASENNGGVTKQKYQEALDRLGSLKLNLSDKEMIERRYWEFGGTKVEKIGDLCRAMLHLVNKKNNAQPEPGWTTTVREAASFMIGAAKDCKTVSADVTAERLQEVIRMVVHVLEDKRAEVGNKDLWVTRYAVSTHAMQLYRVAKDDVNFVLSRIDGVVSGEYVVSEKVDPITQQRHYLLKRRPIYKGEIYDDLLHIYHRLMLNDDSKLVVDTQRFAKEWPVNGSADGYGFTCRLMTNIDGDQLRLPPYSTVGNLKRECEVALRDMYSVLDNAHVTAIEGSLDRDDADLLSSAPELEKGEISVHVSGVIEFPTTSDFNDDENKSDNFEVGCSCGIRRNDGRQLVECSLCNLWHHLSCHGYRDLEDVPPLFICSRCMVKEVSSSL